MRLVKIDEVKPRRNQGGRPERTGIPVSNCLLSALIIGFQLSRRVEPILESDVIPLQWKHYNGSGPGRNTIGAL